MTEHTAESLLAIIGASGHAQSTFENELLAFKSKPDTWYARAIREDEDGFATERKLLEQPWVRQGSVFGSAVDPIVRGMHAIARADTQSDHTHYTIRDSSHCHFPLVNCRDNGPRHVVTIFNPPHRGCGCNTPEGYPVWGVNGSLGLIATVLSWNMYDIELGLVFPRRNPEPYAHAGFVILRISPDGDVHAETRSQKLDPGRMVMNALGVRAMPMSMSCGGYIEEHMGFPGAEEYLLEHIPTLAQYLHSIAKQVAGEHEHT